MVYGIGSTLIVNALILASAVTKLLIAYGLSNQQGNCTTNMDVDNPKKNIDTTPLSPVFCRGDQWGVFH